MPAASVSDSIDEVEFGGDASVASNEPSGGARRAFHCRDNVSPILSLGCEASRQALRPKKGLLASRALSCSVILARELGYFTLRPTKKQELGVIVSPEGPEGQPVFSKTEPGRPPPESVVIPPALRLKTPFSFPRRMPSEIPIFPSQTERDPVRSPMN